MKILHVTKKYPDALGGDAVVVSNLARCQRNAGSQVVILTSNCDEIRDSCGVFKFGLKDSATSLDSIKPRRVISLLFLIFTAFRVLRSERPDVIHTHSIDMAFFASFAARYYHIPIVHTFHILTFNSAHNSPLRRMFELVLLIGAKPDEIFTLNSKDAMDLKTAGFSNVMAIQNGVNVDDWRGRRRGTGDKFMFVGVGRLEEQKGFQYLIEAAAILGERGEEFEVKIAGDGSLYRRLGELIEEFHVGSHVSLTGRLDQARLRELYLRASAFVLPSLWEGMPLTVLEAWAAGLPCICTTVSSLMDIGQDCSILVKPKDAEGLAEAMELLMTDESTQVRLGQAAERAVLRYSWEAVAEKVAKSYAAVICGR